MKYFTSSIIFTGIAMMLAGIIGYFYGGIGMAVSFVVSAGLLGILETCVSFDNAIVNATVLKNMDETWRHRFLTWGMLIAVFGMRLVFPILIVSVSADVNALVNWSAIFGPGSLIEGTAWYMALFDPTSYKAAITGAHTQIMGFGGVFLLMVFLKFFIDENKEHHWVPFIEKHLTTIGKMESVQVAIAIVMLMVLSPMMHEPEKFFTSGLIGVVSYVLVDGIGAFLGDPTAAKTGLGGFIYLEVVDASFSFDGVIAAFAVTDNFLIIALGLGIGAMFVRSMTLYMVDKGTLEAFKYLEHGAFWAIGFLVTIMFLAAAGIELGEAVTAIGSLTIIGLAILHSMIEAKRAK